ncbi:hypothetical protein H4R99_001207 [Coemansia sp. RSA 1722]|nr:hypothetical protein LPJ57_000519 [Coemansia sp. RSA 486]KAJ2237249.1 hypothetical protein IWW45_001124 [Coemansia sp. RSA 485]KAJ2601414.1 hypothetical protein GGF39_001261 [Coemansia sp. RSA 1721]KAJ2605348.1 hypothetical protein H4R99_001207 [Coemansia sp. RSA 1722]KAJ2638793.1 hypothetical protein GGF40_001391 [Coemansia sp. RSA 1286]
MIPHLYAKPESTAHRRLALLATAALAISLLMTFSSQASDPIYAKTYRDLPSTFTNHSRPITNIVVFGDAGRETDDSKRSKLCGGNLWIDHFAESLQANLVSYAHGYSVINKTIHDRHFLSTRIERVKAPLENGQPMSLDQQITRIFSNPYMEELSLSTLYVLLVDPSSIATDIHMLAKAANQLLLTKKIHRLLVLDTPLPFGRKSLGFDSMQLGSHLVNDRSIDTVTYDSHGFLRRMQDNYYKYGLRHPDRACVHTQRIRCLKPDRFFWCQSGRIGDKAQFYLADDIIQKHFLSSIPLK